jgi:hypothetical protein
MIIEIKRLDLGLNDLIYYFLHEIENILFRKIFTILNRYRIREASTNRFIASFLQDNTINLVILNTI